MRPNNRQFAKIEIQSQVAPSPAEIEAERLIAEDESRMTEAELYDKWYIEDYQRQVIKDAYEEYERQCYEEFLEDAPDQSWLMEEEDWAAFDRMLEEDSLL